MLSTTKKQYTDNAFLKFWCICITFRLILDFSYYVLLFLSLHFQRIFLRIPLNFLFITRYVIWLFTYVIHCKSCSLWFLFFINVHSIFAYLCLRIIIVVCIGGWMICSRYNLSPISLTQYFCSDSKSNSPLISFYSNGIKLILTKLYIHLCMNYEIKLAILPAHWPFFLDRCWLCILYNWC